MLIGITVGIVSLLLLLVLWLLETKRRYRSIAHIPGPKPTFLVGNALDMGRNPVEVLQNTTGFMKKYGKWVQLWIGPNRPYLWTADVKFMEHILSSNRHLDKSMDYSFLHSWLGQGLLVADGKRWKPRRKLLTPAFHFKVLSYFVDVFNNVGDVLVEKLMQRVGEDSVDLFPLLKPYTLDVLCETAMGTSVNAQRNEHSEYVWAVQNACHIVMERTFSAWKQFDILYQFSNTYKTQIQSLKILHDFTDSVIARRRAELAKEQAEAKSLTENGEADGEEFDVLGIKSRFAFLDLMMRSSYDGQKLSDAEVRQEVDTIMFAGHDTTASALCFTLYEIARHPDIQETLVAELRSLFSDDKSRPVDFKDLNTGLKYMDLVIKESLRLYPAVPFFARELKEDITYDGTVLPKGLTLTFNAFVMHRDPELFPQPEEFIPERFQQTRAKDQNLYSYLPFSAGPRNCIGQKYAVLELKATLTKILRCFEILPVPDHKLVLSSELVLNSVTGACVRLKVREDF